MNIKKLYAHIIKEQLKKSNVKDLYLGNVTFCGNQYVAIIEKCRALFIKEDDCLLDMSKFNPASDVIINKVLSLLEDGSIAKETGEEKKLKNATLVEYKNERGEMSWFDKKFLDVFDKGSLFYISKCNSHAIVLDENFNLEGVVMPNVYLGKSEGV